MITDDRAQVKMNTFENLIIFLRGGQICVICQRSAAGPRLCAKLCVMRKIICRFAFGVRAVLSLLDCWFSFLCVFLEKSTDLMKARTRRSYVFCLFTLKALRTPHAGAEAKI